MSIKPRKIYQDKHGNEWYVVLINGRHVWIVPYKNGEVLDYSMIIWVKDTNEMFNDE